MLDTETGGGAGAAAYGLGNADVARALLAGGIAELAFAALMALTAAVSSALLPTCTGDSCMVDAPFLADVLVSPLIAFGATAGALLALRVRRAWLVAVPATVLAGVLLAVPVVVLIGGVAVPSGAVALVGLLGLLGWPFSCLAASAMVNGSGRWRFVPGPLVVVLVTAGVVLNQTVIAPRGRLARIAEVAPQPYAYEDPTVTLNSVNLNEYVGSLEVEYLGPEGAGASLSERVPLTAAQRADRCSPELAVGLPRDLCRRLPAPSPGVAVWRTADDTNVAFAPYVVVARPDATIVVFSSEIRDDATALAVVERLRPTTAEDLLRTAEYTSV